MLKRNLLTIILCFLMWQTVVFSQDFEPTENFLSRSKGDVSFDYMQELMGSVYLRALELEDNKKPIAVVRVCSDKPIETTLLKSALEFPPMLRNFKLLGFSGKKLLILKSPDCISEIEFMAATEIWAIYPNDELPPHTEQYTSEQITIKVIDETIYRFVGHPNYMENAWKLIKELQNDKAAKGVIFGIYNRKPEEITGMLKRVSRLLEKNGIDKSRYTVEVTKRGAGMSINYINYPPRSKRTYPSFFSVRVDGK